MANDHAELSGYDTAEARGSVSRRVFVKGAGLTSFGLLLAACGGSGDSSSSSATEAPPSSTEAPSSSATETAAPSTTSGEEPLKQGLADGMYGGPTGFDGAERYQYPLDSEEGRAISALRAMKAAGNAPNEIVVQTLDFARPQFEKAFPQSGPSIVQLFEEETGIKIKFVETTPADAYATNIRNASTKNGSFDCVTFGIEEMGDMAEAGLIAPLDEYVDKYQPSWGDPEFGYLGGESTVNLFTKYNGKTYAVAFDNDTQPYFHRGDLLDNPDEQKAFEDKYGRPLAFPETWEQQAEVAAFFTRPDKKLYGDVATLAPFWCVVNFNQRFVCAAAPNNLYFKEDGSANINNEAGVTALSELLKSLEWHGPGALEKDWFAQYQLMGAGNGWGGGSFPNMTKLVPGNPDLDTAGVGKDIRSGVMPGRVVDGQLIRRPVIFFNISYGVNAFADKAKQEAAYLFLQWAGGARVYTWLTFNPGGYQDPHHGYSLDDNYVIESYKQTTVDAFKDIIPRTAPPITIKGGGEYRQAVSDVIQKVLTKQSTPEAGAKELDDKWNAITDKIGTDKQVAALETLNASFPTVTDTPSA